MMGLPWVSFSIVTSLWVSQHNGHFQEKFCLYFVPLIKNSIIYLDLSLLQQNGFEGYGCVQNFLNME